MMSAIIRQLYCHIAQGRQLVNVTRVLSTTFPQRRRQCHDQVMVASENQEIGSHTDSGEPAGENDVKTPFKKKSSFDRLRRNKENESSDRNETNDKSQLNQEKKHFRGIESDDGSKFSDEKRPFRGKKSGDSSEFNREKRTLRRKKPDELDEENSRNNAEDGNESTDGKKFLRRNKTENSDRNKTGDRNNKESTGRSVQGSGNRFGVTYNNKKFPVKGEVLFGYHPVHIALTRGQRRCHKLFLQRGRTLSPDVDILGLAKEAKIPVEQVSRIHLDQLCLGRPHQGICMDAAPLSIQNLSPDDIRSAIVEPAPIWMLPYEIVDPMNMGAIIRSSYYFGVDTILLPSNHSAAASPMVSKASSGAMEVMKLFYLKNKTATQQFLQDWKAKVGQIIGTSSTGADTVAVADCVVTRPTLLIVGNEHGGLKEDILQHCDQVIKLHEFSRDSPSVVGSLNVSVATGIVLHALKTNRTDK